MQCQLSVAPQTKIVRVYNGINVDCPIKINNTSA